MDARIALALRYHHIQVSLSFTLFARYHIFETTQQQCRLTIRIKDTTNNVAKATHRRLRCAFHVHHDAVAVDIVLNHRLYPFKRRIWAFLLLPFWLEILM